MIKNSRYSDNIPAVVFSLLLVCGALFLSWGRIVESSVFGYCSVMVDVWWNVFLTNLPLVFIITPIFVLVVMFVFFQIRKLFILSKTFYVDHPQKLEKLVKQYELSDVYVYKSEVAEASCVGVFFPKIHISTRLIQLLEEDELLAVLLHERHHKLHGHMFVHLGASFIQPLGIVFPFLSDVLSVFLLKIEKNADLAVVREMGDSASLLSAFRKTISVRNQYGLSFSEFETIERRIFALQGKKRGYVFSKTRIVSSFLVVMGLGMFFVMPSYAEGGVVSVAGYCQEDACITQCAHKERDLYEKEIRYSAEEKIRNYSPEDFGK